MAEITLADVSEKLNRSNENLGSIDKNISKMSGNLGDFIQSFKDTRGDELERDIEAKRKQTESQQRVKVKEQDNNKGLFGGLFDSLLGGLPAGFGIGAVTGFLGAIGSAILRRGIPALLANVFADSIADFIEDQSGSKPLGDAVFRALKLGSFGLLLGRKFALFGAVIGALLTPENRMKLEDMEVNLSYATDQLEKFFDFSLPSFEGILEFITTTFGEGLDGINAALAGDFDSKAFKENWDEALMVIGGFVAAVGPLRRGVISLFKNLTKAIGTAALAITGFNKALPEAPPVTTTGPAPKFNQQAANTEAAKNLSKRQIAKLEKQGLKVNKVGEITDLKGKTVSVERATEGLKKSGVKVTTAETVGNATKKFPRLGKFLGFARSIPGLSTLIGLGTVASILMDDSIGDDAKIVAIGNALGGIGGGALGTILGAMAGGPIGAVLGGVGGYVAGGTIGEAIGEYLLGRKISAFGGPFAFLNDLANNALSGNQQSTKPSGDISENNKGINVEVVPNTPTGFQTKVDETKRLALTEEIAKMGSGGSSVVVMDNSNKSVNTSETTNQAMIAPAAAVFDKYDAMSGTRHPLYGR